MDNKPKVRIELTEDQRQQLKERFSKDFEALEFTAEELEERIAPSQFLAKRCATGEHFPKIEIIL